MSQTTETTDKTGAGKQSTGMQGTGKQGTGKHGPLEDAQGIFYGTVMAAFGIVMLTQMGLVTGQTAGLAVLLSYVTGLSFGTVFFLVNLPFYWLAFRRMGVPFTLKTFLSVGLLSLFAQLLPKVISFDMLHPAVGAVIFGLITGSALLALFRHGASLGGVGVLALYLQEKTGFRAGLTQLLFDLCVFTFALFVLDLPSVLYSLLGAVVINFVIAVNHRKDWYVAT